MSRHEDDLPVLNAVVESGNHSIIQSTRLGNEVLRELESLRQDAVRAHVGAGDEVESDTLSGRLAHPATASTGAPEVEIPTGLDFASLGTISSSANSTNDTMNIEGLQVDALKDEELETMIDDIVDRHITALRRDIRQLLDRARSSP